MGDLGAWIGSLQNGVSQGVLWGIMVLGVYITYKLLNVADLTVDGSFTLGGCICALLVYDKNVDPITALFIAMLAGMAAGAVTGILHIIFEIPAILAGILTQLALWSVNLRITDKQSSINIQSVETPISWLSKQLGITQSQAALIIGIVVAMIVVSLLYWFFGTEIGSALRATGNNEDMVRALGVDTRKTKLLALMLSNGLVGLSGALVTQSQKFYDINMGTGAIVIGLAAIVIGEVLMGKLPSFYWKLVSAVVGAVIYFIIRAIVLRLGLDANDMKMISAIIVVLALAFPTAMAKHQIWKSYSEEGEESC